MLSAVDNIKKQDERYKRYILLQILSSVVSGIMIVSGVLMFVFGNYEIAGTELAGQYDLFDIVIKATRLMLNGSERIC